MKKIHYLNIINFLAAFLLFQIELIIAKVFLPKFGGSYLVWGACVVFFQCILLSGYLYSHIVIQKLGIARYRYFHPVLLFLPLLCFPGKPLANINSHYNIPLVADIFGQLLFSIGLVFFVLSTTSIIFQSWLAASDLPQHSNPYALYATSNLGSFLALLTYPFFFEANFTLGTQLNIWRFCYFLLALFSLISFRLVGVTDRSIRPGPSSRNISTKEKLRFFLLSAASVIAFLSVTNIITYEIAPAPLLWILPLCIYLISFVLNFKERIFCPVWIKNKFHLTIAFSLILFFLTQQRILPFMIELAAYSLSLFIICMFCQNELSVNKPEESKELTTFYLLIALGSFVGGIWVSWIMPLISVSMVEYLLSFFIIYFALIIGEKRTRIGAYHVRLISYLVFLLILWPLLFTGYNIFGLILIFLAFKFIYTELKAKLQALHMSLLLVLAISPLMEPLWTAHDYIYAQRNYYGIYRIFEENGVRFLLNGTTLHGAQYISQKKEMEPIAYYHRLTPVGKLLESNIFNFHRIGVIGLGSGALAGYGKPGQTIDFFELDPDVFRIANRYFSYLKKSPAKINYIFGDARVSLNKVSKNQYDLLIVDAFSGDSVPIHLLTTEAISTYKDCIAKNGIILFHVSNRYLNLVPVLFSNARALNAQAGLGYNAKPPPKEFYASVWVALTWSKRNSKGLTSKLNWYTKLKRGPIRYIRPWTDTYSAVLSVLKLDKFIESIKTFQPFYW